LDALGDVSHRLGDAAVAGDVVKEFQMMNVHGVLIQPWPDGCSPSHRRPSPNRGSAEGRWLLTQRRLRKCAGRCNVEIHA
jgi:hypothetical protein